MSFYPPEKLKKIKSLESEPVVLKNVFTKQDVARLIDIERIAHQDRMVDRADSRKTKIDWKSEVKEIIYEKLTKVLGREILIGDFPAHFIKNRYPLRIHADMGKDPTLIPHKNILIPLF